MSDGAFEDIGAVPGERCRHLRTKMMSVVTEWEEHATEFPSTSAAYWCLRTMGPVGPDDGPAELDDCRAGRACYQKLP
jgi:hypothetical protein